MFSRNACTNSPWSSTTLLMAATMAWCGISCLKVGECLHRLEHCFKWLSQRHTAFFCPYFDHTCLRYGWPHSTQAMISDSTYLKLYFPLTGSAFFLVVGNTLQNVGPFLPAPGGIILWGWWLHGCPRCNTGLSAYFYILRQRPFISPKKLSITW